jgi:hypothetical protein
MEPNRFDGFVRWLSSTPSRRAVGRGLAGLTASSVFAPLKELTDAEAKKKKRKKKCKGGKKKCGKKCVDFQIDPANCGGCGKQCATGQACQQGTCPGGACDALVATVDELHAALENRRGQPDYVICLEAGTYALPPDFFGPASEPWNLNLPDGVTLLGAGAEQTILQGSGGGYGVIGNLFPFSGRLASLTITGGASSFPGGGIYMQGEMTLSDCVISGNTAGNGGGIYNVGQLVLDGCTITGNTAHTDTNEGVGGGVYNAESLTRTNTTISGNTSDSGPDCINVGPGTGC